MDPALARKALGAIRIGVGIASFAAPKPVGAAMGIDPDAAPAAAYMTRMFAARELLLGWLQFADGPIDPVAVTRLAIGVDAADAAAAVLGGAAGDRPWAEALPGAGIALGGVALGVLGSRPAT